MSQSHHPPSLSTDADAAHFECCKEPYLSDDDLRVYLLTLYSPETVDAVLDPTNEMYIQATQPMNPSPDFSCLSGEVPSDFKFGIPSLKDPLFGVKKVQCDSCFSFMRANHLPRHKRACKGFTHGILPGKYVCPYCVELRRLDNRSHHIKMHRRRGDTTIEERSKWAGVGPRERQKLKRDCFFTVSDHYHLRDHTWQGDQDHSDKIDQLLSRGGRTRRWCSKALLWAKGDISDAEAEESSDEE